MAFLKTPEEMEAVATSQIGKSACGPTAIINVLAALDVGPLPTPSEVLSLTPARLRDYETKSLSQYLLSRARAGTIHEEILSGTKQLSAQKVAGKFFLVRPHEDLEKLEAWITTAFKKRIAMVLTENLFVLGNDAWHHQMAYGVKERKVFLTNPLQSATVAQVSNWITAGSWMIIPNDHVRGREVDREELGRDRWESFSVLDQVESMFRDEESKGPTSYKGLTIPWGGLGGVTLFCRKDNKEGMDWLDSYKSEKIYLPFYDKYTEAVKLSL